MFTKIRRSRYFIQLAILIGLFLALPLATFIANQVVNIRSKATSSASILFVPQTEKLPPDGTFSLQLNAGTNQISFVHVEMMFDRSKIQLADVDNALVTSPQLQRKVVVTDKTSANQNGIIILALGLDPGAAAPTGTFELIRLPFTVTSTTPNDATEITISDSKVVLVDAAANPVSLTVPTPRAQLTLNELIVASPQLTASPSPIATTPTPAPSALDNTPPSVTITNPLNGTLVTRNSTVTISATATDNVRVTKVEFREGGKLLCTDTTSSYTCAWTITGKPNASYSLEAKAYDGAGNTNTSRITVTSTAQ